jgi:hypothetical protein
MKKRIYPEGYYVGQGIAIGIVVGVGIGIALGNPAIGVGAGVAIGVGVGAGIEAKAKKEGRVRSLTKEERRIKKRIFRMLIAAGLVVFTLGIAAYFLTRLQL